MSRAQRASAWLACGYLAGLVAAILGMTLVGGRSWATEALLYLPRTGFALPLPIVALALLVLGPRRWLVALPLPIALLLFPLMGLQLGRSRSARTVDRPSLRVVSVNVGTVRDADALLARLQSIDPDVVLLQEYRDGLQEPLGRGLPGLAHRHTSTQFHVLSRFPLSDVIVPARLSLEGGGDRSARFVRYTVASPLGPVAVFNVHPVSPRTGLEELRGDGVWRQLLTGRIASAEAIRTMNGNARLRELQVATWASQAAASELPVVIAGDTNLPVLSPLLRRHLGDFDDGFARAGRGFGNTFPAHHPWMRIDRVLARGLAFDRFETIDGMNADHLGVCADLVALDAEPTTR